MAHSLEDIQLWMQTMLLTPRDSEEATFHIAPSNTLNPSERLNIYQRSYFARLIECLKGQYKALCHALGEDLFRDFARDYLLEYPSQNPTLALLGEKFADFLEKTRPDKQSEEKETWIDFMVDLARFEWLLYTSFDAAGWEPKDYLRQQDHDNQLTLQPCFFLGKYQFPVSIYYHQVAIGNDPPIPAPSPHFVAIVRKNYRCGISPLTEPQFSFLHFLKEGHTVESTIQQTATQFDRPIDTVRNAWTGWRKNWIDAGFFISQ